MHVGRVLRFGGQRLVILIEECVDVTFHGEAVVTLFVVPVKVNVGVLLYFPVSGDGVVLLKSGEEVFGVAFLPIRDDEIIYY